MLYFIGLSILIRAVAVVWSVMLWSRQRDMRLGWLCAVMLYMFGRQALTLAGFLFVDTPRPAELLAEILAMGVSLFCLGALWGLGRIFEDAQFRSKALERSEATQRALLDAIPDTMFRMSRDGTYLGYQARDESRLLVPPSEFMGRRVGEVLGQPLADACMRALEAAFATGRVQTYEYEYPLADQTAYWEVRVSVCGPDEALVLVREVSHRKRMELQLLRTSDDLERAQVIAHAGTWVSEAESAGRLTWSNQTCRIFGFEPDAFDQRVETFFRHVHPDDVAVVREAARASFADDTPYDVEHRIVRTDGQVRWVHQQAGVVRDPQGRALRMIGVVHDITERKLAQLSLAESEQRYRRLFDLSPQPMFVFEDGTLRFLAVNDAAIREYGCSEAEFLSMTIRDIRPPEDVPDLLRRLAAAADTPRVHAPARHRRKDGSLMSVQVHVSAVEFHGQRAHMVIATDLTDQRRAQEALRESEERYRRLAEHGAVGIWEIDANGRTIFANPAMRRLLEVDSIAELRATSFRSFFPPESLKTVDIELERRRRGEASVYQVEMIGARGGRRAAIISGAPMIDRESELTSLIGTFTDITDLRLAQEQLRSAESRYRTIFEQSPDGIMLLDPVTARPIEANSVLLRIMGYSEKEFLALTIPDIEASESPEQVRAHLHRIVEQGEDAFESRLRTKSGGIIDVALRIRVLELGGDKRLQIILRDITRQKRDEERLHAAEQRNAAMIRQTPLGVIMWDTQKRVLEWNPTAEQIFGYTHVEALGKSFEKLIVPESARAHVDRIWAGLLTATGGVRSTNENVTRNGRRIICEWYNTALLGADGQVVGVASLVQDVTEVRRLEEELRQSQKMEAIGRLASGVAHDFSNLLTAISGFTSLARRTLSPQHPAVTSLDRVDDAARQAVGVTKSLLTFSRGGGGAPKGPVHLGKAVEDAARILRRTLPANVVMRVKMSPQDIFVHGDTTQLQQVVMNLAINSRDAMPRGGSLAITVSTRPADGRAEAIVAVADTGTGISDEVRSRIFEPFFTTKPTGQGTGLGLSITHAIIKDHGGRIEVESAPDKGSIFTIILPVSTPPDPDEQPLDGTSAPALLGRGQTVLLTSGRAYLRELMASALTSMGFSIVQFDSLEAAANAAPSSGARVHIVDVETLGIEDEEVINQSAHIPGRMTTIYLIAGAKSSDWNAGAGSIAVPKPFQISELAGTISEALQ